MKFENKKLVSIIFSLFIVFALISCAKKLEYKISSTEALTAVRNYNYKTTGEAYETVQVPGIIDDEEKTGERLNIKDYMDK